MNLNYAKMINKINSYQIKGILTSQTTKANSAWSSLLPTPPNLSPMIHKLHMPNQVKNLRMNQVPASQKICKMLEHSKKAQPKALKLKIKAKWFSHLMTILVRLATYQMNQFSNFVKRSEELISICNHEKWWPMASIRFFKKSRNSSCLPTYVIIGVIFLVRNSQSHKTKFPLNLQWTKSINNAGLTGIISFKIEITNNSLGKNRIQQMKTIKWSIRIYHPVKNYRCCPLQLLN